MTVNLISDVHATLDNNLKVIYAFPQKLTVEECINILESEAAKRYENAKVLSPEDANIMCSEMPMSDEERIALASETAAKLKIWEKLSLVEKKECVKNASQLVHWHRLQNPSDQRGTAAKKLADVKSWMLKTYSTFDPAKLEPADYLVIAGDLGLEPTEPAILDDIKKKTAGKFKDVFYIAGNHSHWWHSIEGISNEKPDHVNLDHDYFKREVPGGWLFLGCTLWTPIRSHSAKWRIARYMNDYRYIPGKFGPDESTEQFDIQSTWLKSEIEANRDKKIVVFTHHQPFPECIEDDYKHNDPWASDNVAEAYAVLDGTFDKLAVENPHVKIWLCGHTHQPFDKVVNGIRVVRNPIGYSDFYLYEQGSSECDPANWYNKVIDLGE